MKKGTQLWISSLKTIFSTAHKALIHLVGNSICPTKTMSYCTIVGQVLTQGNELRILDKWVPSKTNSRPRLPSSNTTRYFNTEKKSIRPRKSILRLCNRFPSDKS